MSSSTNSSIVWTYFKKVDTRSVSCNLCGKNYKSSGNTTNLATHLKNKHHHAYAQLTIKKKTNIKTATTKNAEENTNNTSIAFPSSSKSNPKIPKLTGSNSCSDNHEDLVSQVNYQEEDNQSSDNISIFSTSSKLKQQTILQLFEKNASFDDGGDRHIAITQSLIYMIIKDNLPLSCVEKEGLKQFVRIACPRYKLPSRFKVTDLIEQRYSITKDILVNHLQGIRYLTMSSDIVTVTNSTRSFLIITVHFLNVDDASLNSCCLTAHYMTEGHTGEYIKDCFENITSEFSIDKSQIVNFSTDNGSNMLAAVNLFLGAKRRIPCVAHTINLIIDGVLKKNSNFLTLADQIKLIVTYFKHSVSASDQLRSEQLAEGKKEGQILMLIQAVSTRWNSCLDMMERFLKLSSIVAKVLASRTKNKVPDMVATSQLTVLNDLVTLLGPFKIVTEDLSAEKYVTASLVIPLTNLLKQEIEQTKTSTAVGVSVQNDLLNGIEVRLMPLQDNFFLAKATILDPRFKKLHFMSAMAVANAISDLSKEIIAEHKIRGNRSPTIGVSPRTEKETTSSLWDRHEDMLLKNMPNANEVSSRSFGSIPAELKQYLDQPNISRSSNVLKFWIDSRHFTPVLSEIAIKYLISSATSVASERVASTINLLVPNNRSSQTAEHIKQRVFLKTLTEKYWYT